MTEVSWGCVPISDNLLDQCSNPCNFRSMPRIHKILAAACSQKKKTAHSSLFKNFFTSGLLTGPLNKVLCLYLSILATPIKFYMLFTISLSILKPHQKTMLQTLESEWYMLQEMCNTPPVSTSDIPSHTRALSPRKIFSL